MKGIFIDIETNGLDPDINSPLEVCVIICDLHTMTRITEFSSLIQCSPKCYLYDSDPNALLVNGITLDEVKDAKTSYEVCEDLEECFLCYEIDKTNSVFICQNPSFDRSFFNQIMPVEVQQELELPYHWLDLASMYWARTIDITKPVNGHNLPGTVSLSKDNIARNLGLPAEDKPHRAKNGVHHLIECYRALMYNSTSN